MTTKRVIWFSGALHIYLLTRSVGGFRNGLRLHVYLLTRSVGGFGWWQTNCIHCKPFLQNCCILHPPKTAHTICSLAGVTASHSDPHPNHRRQRPELLVPVASLSDRQVITCQGFNVHTLKSLQTVCLALVARRITMSSIPAHKPHSGSKAPPQSAVAHTRRPNCFEEIQLKECLRDGNPNFTLRQDGYGDCDTARSRATVFEATN